jgi:hypothetical protein
MLGPYPYCYTFPLIFMRMIPKLFLIGLFQFLVGSVLASEPNAAAEKTNFQIFTDKLTTTRPQVEKQVDSAIGKYPLFSILSADKPDFRKFWEDKLVLDQIKTGIQTTDEKVVEVGAGMALIMVQIYYLSRADDESTNAYLVVGANTLGGAGNSCKLLLDKADQNSSSQKNSSRKDGNSQPTLDRMVAIMTAIIISSRNRDVSILSKEEIKKSMLALVEKLEKAHGAQIALNFLQLNSEKLSPAERCQANSWGMEELLTLPDHERAILARTMFSFEGQNMMKDER